MRTATMESQNDGHFYRAKEFAEKSGVTVRTLHLYDSEGLLRPAARTESGYRLYGEAELARLEQILALRFVGFGLEQIKELLEGPARPLSETLRLQRKVIVQQKDVLERAIRAIDDAQRALSEDDGDLWTTLRDVIGVFKMEQDWGWTKNYYSDEALEAMEQARRDTPPEVIAQGERDWAELIAEVEVAKDEDPASEHAQALAARWKALVGAFTRGNAEVHKGLNRLWKDPTYWPKDFKKPYSDEAEAFIRKAMNCAS